MPCSRPPPRGPLTAEPQAVPEGNLRAHYIAAWLGIPIGIVIAAMVILRKRGMELRARSQQAREASLPALRQWPDDG